MQTEWLRYIISFILLVLFQTLLLNNIQLSGYINPYLYVLFILSLPFDVNKYALLFLSFFLGLCIDSFMGTTGMHAAASVWLAFARQGVLRFLKPREGYELTLRPRLQDMGFKWFFTYASLLVLAHHAFLFYLEAFRFNSFFSTAGRMISSWVFTMLLILVAQLFILRKKGSEA